MPQHPTRDRVILDCVIQLQVKVAGSLPRHLRLGAPQPILVAEACQNTGPPRRRDAGRPEHSPISGGCGLFLPCRHSGS
eukprot:11215530-Lingulodinium_polyedra.AAC.1